MTNLMTIIITLIMVIFAYIVCILAMELFRDVVKIMLRFMNETFGFGYCLKD